MVSFFKSPIFWVTVLLQVAGPFLLSFANWCNEIQYISGFGMAYAFWHYIAVHKKEIRKLQEQMAHLHQSHRNFVDAVETYAKGERR